MQSIEAMARAIVSREGGYVNDPDDPGGATNFGVTIHTMRALGLDLDRDGDVDAEDVKRLRLEQAVDIFLKHYFHKPGIARLPEPLRASVFDMYVNSGANAVKILQRLLGDFGQPVAVDGAIGPRTVRATATVYMKAQDYLVDAYGIARRNYYYALADKRPSSRKYAKRRDGGKGGWITRAEEFISSRFHLSRAQHNARIAAWG